MAFTKSAESQSNIQEFFKNKSVFITGGTGFLGKLIVNKLIRSCPQIKHIYLLVRDKKGKSVHERLEDIFNMPVREYVRKTLYEYYLYVYVKINVLVNLTVTFLIIS